MGPKRKEIADDNNWRKSIETFVLNDNEWSVKVVIFEPAENTGEQIFIEKFETFAKKEKRSVIKNINKTDVMYMINLVGVGKGIRNENCRVFEEAFAYVQDETEVPSEMFALIIKHIIISMKNDFFFIKKTVTEIKEGNEREIRAKLNYPEIKNINLIHENISLGASGDEDDSKKKCDTVLRMRGEEWRDKVYVDDYPIDGPNFYVAITGFTDPYLVGSLIKISVPLTAIVQIKIDTFTDRRSSKPYVDKNQNKFEDPLQNMKFFWTILENFRLSNESANDYKNTAFMLFNSSFINFETADVAECIYDDLCYLMYDIQDLTRSHSHYLDNLNIINVPNENPESLIIEHYSQKIRDVPLECVTVYSVLNSIIQVLSEKKNFNKEKENILSKENFRKKLSLEERNETNNNSVELTNSCHSKHNQPYLQNNCCNGKAQRLIEKVFTAFTCPETKKKKYRLSFGENLRAKNEPKIIDFGDKLSLITFHLDNSSTENLKSIKLPVHKLFQKQEKIEEKFDENSKINIEFLLSRLQENHEGNLDFKAIFHLFTCKKIYDNKKTYSIEKIHNMPQNTSQDFKVHPLKRNFLAKPFTKYSKCSSSLSPFKNDKISENSSTCDCCRNLCSLDCVDISELMEFVSNKSTEHIIYDFEYLEKFDSINSVQILLDVYKMFNSIDYKYCQITDSLALMFFNSQEIDDILREEWRSHIPTPICLQDFFNYEFNDRYDFNDHHDLIKQEETLYDKSISMNLPCNQINEKQITEPIIKHLDFYKDFLVEGSLKYQDLFSRDINSEVSESISSKKSFSNVSSTRPFESRSSRRSKRISCFTPIHQQSATVVCDKESLSTKKKPFLSYDLGDRRTEALGKRQFFFSQDGEQISIQHYTLLPMDIEYIALGVIMGNEGSEIWIHKAVGALIYENLPQIKESFRISTKDQVIINVIKNVCIAPFVNEPYFYNEYSLQELNFADEACSQSNIIQKSYFSLSITWPNGLIIESIYNEDSQNISHIKQFYMYPRTNFSEDMRCINYHGEVVIFKDFGDIEVLRPNGSHILITKCEKVSTHDRFSDNGPKSGKSESKNMSKTRRKSTKETISKSEQKFDHIKRENETEVKINEFEFIESSGEREVYSEGITKNLEKLLMCTTSDHSLGEIFCNRIDGTNIFLDRTGLQIVTFPDNTRIISYAIIEENEIYPDLVDDDDTYFFNLDLKSESFTSIVRNTTKIPKSKEDTKHKTESKFVNRTDGYVSVLMKYTIEHVNFATVTVNRCSEKITIDSPNNMSITIDNQNNYDLCIDDETKATFDGQTLYVNHAIQGNIESSTKCEIRICSDHGHEFDTKHNWLNMTDSHGKRICVNDDGEIFTKDKLGEKERTTDAQQSNEFVNKSDEVIKTNVSNESLKANKVRFFILYRDLTLRELVHRNIVEKYYERMCCGQPWFFHDEYVTRSGRRFLSIIFPVHLNESEKWLMESQLADPPYYTAVSKKNKIKKIKKYYHWMRPYKLFKLKPRKPPNVFLDRHPSAFVHRLLEYRGWKTSGETNEKADRDDQIRGTSTTIEMENDEMGKDEIEEIRQEVYEELKNKLLEDTMTSMKPTITTKPFVPGFSEPPEKPKEKPKPEPTKSPNLERYWRKRRAESEKEELHKALLRNRKVPDYFNNMMGGAIWWEINNISSNVCDKRETSL